MNFSFFCLLLFLWGSASQTSGLVILYLSLLCFFTHLLKVYSGGAVDLWSCFALRVFYLIYFQTFKRCLSEIRIKARPSFIANINPIKYSNYCDPFSICSLSFSYHFHNDQFEVVKKDPQIIRWAWITSITPQSCFNISAVKR